MKKFIYTMLMEANESPTANTNEGSIEFDEPYFSQRKGVP